MTSVLSIIGTGYRATIEEQDDTILWLMTMCHGAGLDVDLLLESSAVGYGVRGQDASGLRFGDVDVANPPQIDHDIEALLGKGVAVHYVVDDAEERGIDPTTLVDGLKPVRRADLPSLFDAYQRVWRW